MSDDPRRWIDRAVNATKTFLEANYPAALRALEVRESLIAGTLEDPAAYVPSAMPYDSRTPLVEIYDEGWKFIDQSNGMCAVAVAVVISYLGDAKVEDGAEQIRKYITALIDLIQGNSRMNLTVGAAILLGGMSEVTQGDNERTRHTKGQLIEVHVYEPGVAS